MPSWNVAVGPGFRAEFDGLPAPARESLARCLAALVGWLDRHPGTPIWLHAAGAAFAAYRPVRPLAGARRVGSYLLRCGRYRLAFVSFPDERELLMTALAPWDQPTYASLVRLHDERHPSASATESSDA